jgi:hypothetical protein
MTNQPMLESAPLYFTIASVPSRHLLGNIHFLRVFPRGQLNVSEAESYAGSASEKRMLDLFGAMDSVLRTHPEVGDYNQKT